MELREAIRNRRSIRKFKDIEIPREKIEELLQSALWAPSGMNSQNWHFVIVKDTLKERLIDVSRKAFDGFILESLKKVFKGKEAVIKASERFFRTLGNAPVIVCVYRTSTVEGELTDIQSVAAAIENFLLLLHEQGYGGCWMTGPVHLRDEINRILGVEGKKLQALIPI
ncbi:MAG: nitroreductase family protein, partial [Candidatus Cloacimonadota bacterium]